MQISQLQATDAEAYRRLMLQAYAEAADAFTSTAEERAAEPHAFWLQRVADPKGLEVAWGAFDGTDLVGTVALQFSAKPKTRHKAKLIAMYVAPQARSKGAGRALLAAAIAFAEAQNGLHQLSLTVTEGNAAAMQLYRAVQFQVFGVEPMAILTPAGYLAKVHMWRPVHGAQHSAL